MFSFPSTFLLKLMFGQNNSTDYCFVVDAIVLLQSLFLVIQISVRSFLLLLSSLFWSFTQVHTLSDDFPLVLGAGYEWLIPATSVHNLQ